MNSTYKTIYLLALALGTLFSQGLAKESAQPKRALKTNYQLIYLQTPQSVENLGDMFKEGIFYGRLRSNSFYYKYEDEDSSQSTHTISGLGGSIVYRSAVYANFDFALALYGSRGFFDDSDIPVSHIKPGKGVISRFDYINSGKKSMGVLGEAYLRYEGIEKTSIRLGRQLIETFYAKSNDSKMIPNSFDGIYMETKALKDTYINLAYLTKEKLRDHTNNHSILMYGDANSTTQKKPQWSQNDDTAMHKGLTYTALKAAGISTDAPLILGDIRNRSLPNTKIDASFYIVPELLSQVMVELNYKFKLQDSFSLTPGVRYIRQFDDNAGRIGGASYSGKTTGYKDPDSLDAQMIAARLVAQAGEFSINLGYSYVLDEADLITPWRGFPTAGYTRSMAQYNWKANTKSYRIAIRHNFRQDGIYHKLCSEVSFLHTDGDESKGFSNSDKNYYYAGFVQNIPDIMGIKDLQWRLRLGYTDSKLEDGDTLDGRFELNYLF